MNFVEPIREKNKINEMKYELKKSGTRNYMLFFIGIHTGLRIFVRTFIDFLYKIQNM